MIKVIRTPKDDFVECPKCGLQMRFINCTAPFVCNVCSSLFPDVDEMAVVRGTPYRITYHLDRLLYD